MTAPGIMHKFRMTAIAAVDSPAQKGARVAIMKRDEGFDDSAYEKLCKRTFTADQRHKAEQSGAAMPGGRYPIENVSDLHNAIRAVGRGKGSHAAIRRHIMSRAKALGATGAIPDNWHASKMIALAIGKSFDFDKSTGEAFAERIAKDAEDGDPEDAGPMDEEDDDVARRKCAKQFNEDYRALVDSVASILKDDTIADEGDLLQKTFDQFKDAIRDVVPDELEATIGKALSATDRGTDHMSKAIAKALGLPETATDTEIERAIVKLAQTEMAVLKQIAALNGLEKAYHDWLPEADRAGFLKADAAGRKELMKAKKMPKDKYPKGDEEDKADGGDDEEMEKMIRKGDAFRSEDGTVYTKADFGSDRGFRFAKSQAESAKKNAELLAKSEDERLAAAFTKRAEALEYIGKADEVGALLHDIAKLDSKLADRVEVLLKGTNKALAESELYKEHGSSRRPAGGGSIGKAAGEIESQAKDLLAKSPELFKNVRLDKMAASRAEIRKRNPALAKQEQEEKDAEDGNANKRRRAA